jgi:hypothetical protein
MPTQTPPNGAALPQGGPPPSNPPSTPTPTTNVSRVANAAQMATAVPLTIESFLAMVANTPQTQQNAAMAISPAQLAHLSAMWQASQVPATPPMMRPYHPPPPLNVTPARASQNATAVASIDGDIWERENDIIPPPSSSLEEAEPWILSLALVTSTSGGGEDSFGGGEDLVFVQLF